MTGSPQETWARIEELLALLPAAREQMKYGKTGALRDAGTKHYVELVDKLAEGMLTLHRAGVTQELGAILEAIYGGAD